MVARLIRRTVEVARHEGPRRVVVKAYWTARNACVNTAQRRRLPGVIRRLGALPPDAATEQILDFGWTVGRGLLRPDQVREEFAGLIDLAFRPAPVRRFLEIGTHNGGTLFGLSRSAAPDATIISVDLPHGRFGGGYPAWKEPLFRAFARPAQTMHLIRADSHQAETLQQVRGILGAQKLDFLLIDGDHTYDGVRLDYEMYSPLVRSGGHIAFHDVAEHAPEIGCEVDRYWNELKQRCRHVELIRSKDQAWAGIGVVIVP